MHTRAALDLGRAQRGYADPFDDGLDTGFELFCHAVPKHAPTIGRDFAQIGDGPIEYSTFMRGESSGTPLPPLLRSLRRCAPLHRGRAIPLLWASIRRCDALRCREPIPRVRPDPPVAKSQPC